MKKSIGLLMVLVLLVTVCSVSCGESLKEKIAGTWYRNYEYTPGSSLAKWANPSEMSFEFNEDGTGTVRGLDQEDVIDIFEEMAEEACRFFNNWKETGYYYEPVIND